MNLNSAIARRYLFSHKGTHFINIISGMTVLGLSIGSAAVILVLSIFNGFEELIASMINTFNPDLKIVPAQGKYFSPDSTFIAQLKEVDGIMQISRTIEETAIFEYGDANSPGLMKGVDDRYQKVSAIDSTMIEGEFVLREADKVYAVLGSGMARNLSADVLNVFESLSIHMPNRRQFGGIAKPYRTKVLRPSGIFSIQQEIDNQYILVPLEIAQDLLSRRDEVSALEVKVSTDADIEALEDQIAAMAGTDLQVLNRYEQDEDFLKLMNIEKWMAFLIASLMIFLISFNLIGCLWMIVLDKRKDIAILKAMGSTGVFIRRIFLNLGLMYTLVGLGLGILLAAVLYFAQQQFGIITMAQGFVVDRYPIKMKITDVLIVGSMVLTIGAIASLPVAFRATKLGEVIREQ
ncbi:MAG: FtsX-like permease family protein [Saprospiraceae bacterium]|nr:FtsX-like permease family protein [Saprospiraceae bacterium]